MNLILFIDLKSYFDADVLSRYLENMTEQTAQIPFESVKVVCASIVSPPLETISMSVDILTATEFPSEPMDQNEQKEIRKHQLDDRFLGYRFLG